MLIWGVKQVPKSREEGLDWDSSEPGELEGVTQIGRTKPGPRSS